MKLFMTSWIFSPIVLSISESEKLTSPAVFFELSIYPFISVHLFSMHFGALMLDGMIITVIYLWCIGPSIIIQYSPLFLKTIFWFVLKMLSDNSITSLAFSWFLSAWCIFLDPFASNLLVSLNWTCVFHRQCMYGSCFLKNCICRFLPWLGLSNLFIFNVIIDIAVFMSERLRSVFHTSWLVSLSPLLFFFFLHQEHILKCGSLISVIFFTVCLSLFPRFLPQTN